MADIFAGGGGDSRRGAAVVMGVYATLALDMFGSVTSSPQTTELFAQDREETLLKYVLIADAGGLLIGTAMSFVDGSPYPLIGALIILVPMHFLYQHAALAGRNQAPPLTASQAQQATGTT